MASERLSQSEAAEVGEQIGMLADHSLPLATGLRLAAQESGRVRVRRALNRLAEGLESGQPLCVAVERIEPLLGSEVAGLVKAGAESGRLTDILTAMHGDARARHYIRRQVANVLIYPTILMLGSIGFLFFTMLFVVPQFKRIFQDFGISLPSITAAVLAVSDFVVALQYPLLAGLVLFAALVAVVGLRPEFQDFVHRVPLLGPVIRWSAEMSGLKLLGLLTEVDVPLPNALRHVSASTLSTTLRSRARAAADAASQGSTDWWRVYGGATDIANLAGLTAVGVGKDKLSSACFAAAEILEGRIRAMLHQVQLVFPATIFAGAMACAAISAVALILPMIKLLNALGN